MSQFTEHEKCQASTYCALSIQLIEFSDLAENSLEWNTFFRPFRVDNRSIVTRTYIVTILVP